MRRRGRLVLLVSTVGAGVLALLVFFHAMIPSVALTGRVTFQGTPSHPPGTFSLPGGRNTYSLPLQVPDESFLMEQDGSLANVLVYIEVAPAAKYSASGEPIPVVRRNGLYGPRILGVRAGQPIEFRNEDGMHTVTCRHTRRNALFNMGQTAGDVDTRTFENAEPPPVLSSATLIPGNSHIWASSTTRTSQSPASTGPSPSRRS